MRLITVRDQVRNVAKRWRAQYPRPEDRTGKVASGMHRAIGEALERIDPDFTSVREVDRIIGNGSWTKVPGCSECKRDDLERVLEVGEVFGWESHTVYLCEECATHAVECFITGKDRPRAEPEPFEF